MWKYVTRRIRDTFERSANHFDKRSSTIINPSNSNLGDEKNKCTNSPCCWFISKKCGSSFRSGNDTNNKRWNFDQLNRTWIGAITWSSALVFGWYTSQLLHLKLKNESKIQCKIPSNCWFEFLPFLTNNKNHKPLTIKDEFENHVSNISPIVHLISNDHVDKEIPTGISSTNSHSSQSSDDDLGEVLNSIENRLGLAAIENGHQQDGLNLLRSAANRNHAPALYNLGLCYEQGLGVEVDEKMAMELYKSAAALQHPGALYNLGIYYGQGRGGLTKDRVTATRLLKLAAIQGEEHAITALKSIDDKTPDPSTNTWTDKFATDKHNSTMPIHSALFIDNVALHTCNFKYQPVF